MADTEGISFEEEARRVIGRALADLELGYKDSAVNALGALLTRAETLSHGQGMTKETADPNRYSLNGLKELVNPHHAAPELGAREPNWEA